MMKNRLCVFGTDELTDCTYINGNYYTKSNNILNSLCKIYDIDNFSYKNLTLKHATRDVLERVENYKYNSCLISTNLLFNTNLSSEEDLSYFFKILKDNNINVFFLCLSKDQKEINKAKEFNNKYDYKLILEDDIILKNKNEYSKRKIFNHLVSYN